MFNKIKAQLEEARIGLILGYRSGRDPLENYYHAMFNKDHTMVYLWTGKQLFSREVNPLQDLLEISYHFDHNWNLRPVIEKDHVSIPID